MADSARSLLTASVATVDVAVFVLVAVLAGHASGALSDLLAGLGTISGVLVFAYLWTLVLGATWWVLGRASLEASGTGTLALHAFGAGGVAGLAFLLGVVAATTLPLVVTGSVEPVSFALIAAIGGGIATLVGGVVGLLFGLVNRLAYDAAGLVVPDGAPVSDAATAPDRR